MSERETRISADSSELQTASAEYEYHTLMRLMGVSVSKHLLDEHFTLIWANEFYYKFIGWNKADYEAEFHNRPDLFYANTTRQNGNVLRRRSGMRLPIIRAVTSFFH